MDEDLVLDAGEAQQRDGSVPWSLGDIVICVVGGILFGLLAVFMIFIIVAATTRRPSDSVVYLVSGGALYVMVGIIIWLRLVKYRGVSWASIGFTPVGLGPMLLMLPLTIGLQILAGVVAYLTELIFVDVPDATDQLAITSEGFSLTDLICLLIVVAVIGPVVEEIVFRGLLYRYVRARRGIALALVVSSLAFSAIHFIPVLLAVFFVMGFVFGLVAEKTGSLYPAITLHALHNAVSTVLVYLYVG